MMMMGAPKIKNQLFNMNLNNAFFYSIDFGQEID